QSGIGYRLVLSGVPSSVFAGVGSKLNVTGQIVGNQLIASNVFTDQSQIYYPTPLQTSGTLGQLINTETLTCGVTISTYTFQNDNGRSQRLRVASSVATQSGQYLTTGSRVIVTNKLESFDGSTIDALNISQQGFF
ncbi:MAG: hypothetical protein OEX07_13035, partial [Gammaproteobacteria bacterium]|nr:hypothetical protein [Gammaproteobacteria bacterium]